MSNKYIYIRLLLVFIIAVFLRFYRLGEIPVGLYSDEAAIGYNAYSIIKTGRDEFGIYFPSIFKSFNDYKPPVAIYSVAVSEFFFGLTDWAVRFPSAVLGSLGVLSIYALARQLGLSKTLSVLTAGLLAINPWNILFSRSVMEVGVANVLLISAVACFLAGLKKPIFLLFSTLLMVLSFYTYHASLLFIPLLLFILILCNLKKLLEYKKWLIASGLIGLFLLFPLYRNLNSGELLVRAKGISVFSNLPSIDPYNREIGYLLADDNKWWARFIHNRRLVSINLIIDGYLKHFTPQFLFYNHGNAMFKVGGFGMFYFWELFTIPFGILVLMRKKAKAAVLMAAWLMLAPLSSSFSFLAPSVIRSMYMSTPLIFFSAGGTEALWLWLRSRGMSWLRISRWFLLFIILLTSLSFSHFYFSHYSKESKYNWDGKYWEMARYLEGAAAEYRKIVLIPEAGGDFNEPYIFLLYYLKFPPQVYLQQGGTRICRYGHNGRFNFDIYEFRTIGCVEKEQDYNPLDELPRGSLIVAGSGLMSKFDQGMVYKITDYAGKTLIGFYDSDNLTLLNNDDINLK